MRIALDARTIFSDQRRGIGKSLLELYRHLALVRPDWQVIAYHRHGNPHSPQLLPPQFARPRLIEIPGDRFDAWPRLRLPFAARHDGADLLHCPANQASRWMPLPTLVTVHDLIPLEMPETVSAEARRRFARGVHTACRRAAAITCPSDYTRQQLIDQLGADPQRVFVTPWGVTSRHEPGTDELVRLLGRYRVNLPMVLHLGAADTRKNTRRLLEAWAMLRRAVRRHWTLLVVGLDPATMRELDCSCRRLGIASSVVLHGYASETELTQLMHAAEILAYPSLSEGFGLPVLEAFAAGTAVLTSSGTSLPEVAGDAAMQVDPTDWRSIHLGLSRLMTEPLLREQFVCLGRERLAHFDWCRCAELFARAAEAAVRSHSDNELAAA